jgi:hypothetical protein
MALISPTDTTQRTYALAPARLRVVSMDGGGIYGLATAIWLRRLCQEEPRFLAGDRDDVALFAGTSAGALNCLLLAMYEKPREAVLSGELERFWGHPGTFSNSQPIGAFTSLLGVSGWFSAVDFRKLLDETFGDRTLGDLPQQVLVATYNWTGGKTRPSRAGQGGRHWMPKFFHNAIVDDPDFTRRCADVAYAAAAPPVLRAIFGGLGDGGSFSGNPALPAIAHLTQHYHLERNGEDEKLVIARTRDDLAHSGGADDANSILDRIAVLSIGSGQRMPYLEQGDVDRGLRFASMATNPGQGNFWPTSSFGVDAANEEGDHVMKQLLGRDRALRLNPPVLDVPAVPAAMLCRVPLWRAWLSAQIRAHAEGEASTYAVNGTLAYLRSVRGWDAGHVLDLCQWTAPLVLTDRTSTDGPALAALAAQGACMVWKALESPAEEDAKLAKLSDVGTYSNVFVALTEGPQKYWEMQRKAKVRPPPQPPAIPRIMTMHAPALTSVGGLLVMAWCDTSDPSQEGAILLSTGMLETVLIEDADRTDQRVAWYEPQPVSLEGTSTNVAPSLAASGDTVVMAWRTGAGTVRVARGALADGSITWMLSQAPPTGSEPIDAAPAVSAGPDGFVMVWSAASVAGVVWVSRSADGDVWSGPEKVSLGADVAIRGGPALAYFAERWHLAFRDLDGDVSVAVSQSQSPMTWYPAVKLGFEILAQGSVQRVRYTTRPALAPVKWNDEARLVMACQGPNLWLSTLPAPST